MVNNIQERSARMALCALQSSSNYEFSKQLLRYGAQDFWKSLVTGSAESVWQCKARKVDLSLLQSATDSCGSRFIIPGDIEWPSYLAELDYCELNNMGGAPLGLWVKGPGNLARLAAKSVAIVGSRDATNYGELVASDIAAELAARGWAIISGGAYGIDESAHNGALAAGGFTICVVNNGLDVYYPQGNKEMFQKIGREGLLVSEIPPGIRPTKVGFLARNRLIAALSRGVLVVEASLRSGAKNTANWGNVLSRIVMAVPGSIFSGQSETPHNLIRDGEAILTANFQDVISVLSPLNSELDLSIDEINNSLKELSSNGILIREQLRSRSGRSVGELSALTGLEIPECLSALASLEEIGLAKISDNQLWYLRNKNHV